MYISCDQGHFYCCSSAWPSRRWLPLRCNRHRPSSPVRPHAARLPTTAAPPPAPARLCPATRRPQLRFSFRPPANLSSFSPLPVQAWGNWPTTPAPSGPGVRPFPRREPEGSIGVGFRPLLAEGNWNETSTEIQKNEKIHLRTSGGHRLGLHGLGQARCLQMHRLRRQLLPLRLQSRLLLA